MLWTGDYEGPRRDQRMDEPMITSDGAVDAELVSSYLAGDRSALGSIYDRYGQSPSTPRRQ